jgi:Cd2+/Zn2+-exporting ATPase
MSDDCCPCQEKPAEVEERTERGALAAKGAGAALFVVALVFPALASSRLPAGLPLPLLRTGLFAAAYLLVGGDVLWRAIRNILRGQVFDENFLMTIATIGAFCIGEYPEAVAVMLFYQVGEAFQDYAVGRSRKSITALMDIRPDYANLKTGETIRRVSPEEVAIGSHILVKPGEKVPLDGVVEEGVSALDTSALTGESVPRDVSPGAEALSGSINMSGLLVIKVTKTAGESTVAKILNLVEHAGSKKARMENFITRFARWYTPAVVFAAAGLAVIPPLVIRFALGGDGSFSGWIHRALIFLVVSCPCALVISIPLGFFGGIGCASKNGVLVKGSNYLEALCNVDTAVFDKTGTLTRGAFEVTRIAPEPPFTADSLLEYAAGAERFSSHPIALSIRKAFAARRGGGDLPGADSADTRSASGAAAYEDIPGKGVRAAVKGAVTLAGKREFLAENGVVAPESASVPAGEGTGVFVAVDGVFAGLLTASDETKPDAAAALAALKKLGVRRTVMLTGDSRPVAENLGARLGLDLVIAELLPHEKVERFEELAASKAGPKGALKNASSIFRCYFDRLQFRSNSKSCEKLAKGHDEKHRVFHRAPRGCILYAGDGINDAPVLARSDVGVAMGGLGSDAAIEAADIVLMTDELSKLTCALRIARKTRSVVRQNVAIALGVKGAILILGALGMANLWEAVFGDVGVAVIAILNSMRTLRYK